MRAPPDVIVVPGLAVARYLEPTVRCVVHAGADCELVRLPTTGPLLTVPQYATLVADRVRGRDVVLVGHSSGTQVAAMAAREAPVTRLVLGSPTIDPAYRSVPRVVARWLIDSTREPSSLGRQEFPEWRRAGLRRIWVLLRSMLRHPLEDLLAGVTCPVTVVRGERDPMCTPAWAASLGDELVTVPGLPHAFPYQVPDAFARLALGAFEPPRRRGIFPI
ncbi:alpha/beta fold hydrolase [Kutzneria buriramensis]|uniref:Pimeloyl-ACP methyl ester carboxylesterase n=1 Tax=Kutzneria buriramensis TaxID=1045776 RepID=A0A3E0H7M4_9PSEU|nr:alpha/beta hydrolase [Kutzneria buriramensis]REH39318.1 pimeloyl-ACP methyl ester carboxylesterase [Kutzneria buriramensis]